MVVLSSLIGWLNPQTGGAYQRAFLTRRQMEREITFERIRASRRGIPFCVVSITLLDTKKATKCGKLRRLLLRNLRTTDKKAILSKTEFAVLLVDTPMAGGRAVVERLTKLFSEQNLKVEMGLKVHEPSGSDGNFSDHDSFNGSSQEEWSQQAPITTSDVLGSSSQTVWSSQRTSLYERRGRDDDAALEFTSRSGDELVSAEGPLLEPAWVSGFVKRSIDVLASAIGLILVGPLLLLAMALIRLTSPGAAIFTQTREGLRGKPFTIYKLRTMVADAELSRQVLRELSHRDGPAFKIKSDPRVTAIGRFLRATCIDELPQLFNVLRGDMSIVGPRPLPWHESRACNHWHRRRLDVRPGLTCFWQIDKANVESFDDWMRLDLRYVDRGSLWVDMHLIYRTLLVILLGRGSH
jgi:lipopolysaccharide/colanic/teichoic acid biosynthesis glycosyltransferase